HDAVEDQGGLETLEDIRRRYANMVAEIVLSVTDSVDDPKPPWRKRKEDFIVNISTASPQALRVSLADKVYNARATLRDLRRDGEDAWQRFNGGKDGTLWYYEQLIQVYQARLSSELLQELVRLVDLIKQISSQGVD
ncbi:MAG: phosphohydrolase, partial [Chloroflexota bacterium]